MLALIKLASLEWSRWGAGGVEAERAKGGGGLDTAPLRHYNKPPGAPTHINWGLS